MDGILYVGTSSVWPLRKYWSIIGWRVRYWLTWATLGSCAHFWKKVALSGWSRGYRVVCLFRAFSQRQSTNKVEVLAFIKVTYRS